MSQRILNILTVSIIVLAACAATSGLFWLADGEPYRITAVTGGLVTVTGAGLYRNDPLSWSVQAQAQDAVTLFLGVPALAAALLWANRGSLRGILLLTGVLGYFLYTYTTTAFGTSFNPLFLVYVALFGMSIYAVILAAAQVDMPSLPTRCAQGFPRRGIIALCLGTAVFMALAWLGRIGPAIASGDPPYGLESCTTLFIQVMDLGVVAPLAVAGSALLWKRRPLGYLLSTALVVKGASMGIALTAMIVNEARVGEPIHIVEAFCFLFLASVMLLMAVKTIASIRESPES